MQKEIINKKVEDGKKFMEGVKADRAAKELYQDPAYTCDQIINTMNGLKKETEDIFNLPPPKPKEEPKPEEKEGDKKEEEPILPDMNDVKDSLNKDKPDAEM